MPTRGFLAILVASQGFGLYAQQFVSDQPIPNLIRTVYAAGDFDGDGNADLVANAPGSTLITIYRGDGRGRIEPSLNLPTLPRLQIVATSAGDVDGDGDLDIAVLGPTSLDLLINQGGLTFIVRPVLAGGGSRIALADLDGDGDLDLYVAAPGPDSALENVGGGIFATRPWLPPEPVQQGVADLAIGDIDGDGDLDVALSLIVTGPEMLLNSGSGTMTRVALPAPASGGFVAGLGLFDPDGDGDLDLLYGERTLSRGAAADSLWQNVAGAAFAPYPRISGPTPPDTAAVGVVVSASGLTATVLGRDVSVSYPNLGLGAGAGVVTPNARSFFAVDWDGDGRRDVILNGKRRYLRSGTRPFFNAPILETHPSQPDDPEFRWDIPPLVIDIDGDGDQDLCSAGPFNAVFRNDGLGRFAPVGGSRTSIAGWGLDDAGDVDGDGDLDVVAGFGLRLHANDGLGVFSDVTPGRLLPIGSNCARLIDFDGDGDLDLFAGENLRGNFGPDRAFSNDGRGRFTDVTGLVLPSSPVGAVSADAVDVDGDGWTDLVVNRFDATVELLRNQGGTFTRTVLPMTGAYIRFGDLDGDGDLDLMLEGANRSLEWWPNQAGAFGPQVVLLPGNLAFDIGDRAPLLSDVDLDGDLDAIVQSEVWVNDGAGNLAVDPGRFIGNSSLVPFTDYVAIDADGDGDEDLVQIQGPGFIRNRHRQLEVPVPPQIGVGVTCELYHQPGYGRVAATGLLALAFARDPAGLDLPMGRLMLDGASIELIAVLALPPGRSDVVRAVPNSIALLGTRVWFQGAVLEAGGRMALTNGVATRVE